MQNININLYNDQVLKLDNYIINKMGLVKNRSIIKIDDYQIYCVPYEVSYDKIEALAFLSRDEVVFFSRYINTMQSVSFTFVNTSFGKEVPIFLRINITTFELRDEKNRQCHIGITIKRPSDDYKKIIAEQLARIESMRRLYDDEKKSSVVIGFDAIKNTKLDYEVIYKFDNRNVFRGKIIEASLKKIKIVGELFQEYFSNENIILEFFSRGNNFFIKGKVLGKEPSKEMQGLYTLTIEIPFSYPFIDSLSSYILDVKLE